MDDDYDDDKKSSTERLTHKVKQGITQVQIISNMQYLYKMQLP